jgi:hypothetical protein
MAISSVIPSQPLDAVTRGTDFDLTINVANGTAPFVATVVWDNGGSPPDVTTVDPWNNGDPISLTGGYDTLGFKALNITIEDSEGRLATARFVPHVINPLTVNITVEDNNGIKFNPTGGIYTLFTSQVKNLRFRANAANIYTGSVNGTPNTTTFSWDFDGDGTEDETGPSPSTNFTTATPGSNTLTCTLTVTEAVRPSQTFTVLIDVN